MTGENEDGGWWRTNTCPRKRRHDGPDTIYWLTSDADVCIVKALTLESSHVSHYRSQLSYAFGVLPHAPPRQVIYATHSTPGVARRLP